jgi:TPR repeat protein
VLRWMMSLTMKHRHKNTLSKTAGQKFLLAGALLSGCLMRPAFAYDSAKLAAALESLTPATFANWERRAHAGDALAQNVVGMAYKYGEVVSQNHAQSLAWFRKAAEQGDADAQFNLGRIYGKATGPVYGKQRAAPRDDVAAAYWYRKAAKQNYAPAQFNLAEMYAEGSPAFPRDLAHAYFWLQLAAGNGDPNASEQLKDVEGEISPAEKNRASHLAVEWKQARGQ